MIEYEKWWLDSKVHYTYLGFSIAFLIIINLLEDQGIAIQALLLIHLILLFGKMYFNSFLMSLIFGVRERKEKKGQLSERTLKFKAPINNAYRKDTRNVGYKTQNGIQDVLFGASRDTVNRNSNYDSFYQQKFLPQQRIYPNEEQYERNLYDRSRNIYRQPNGIRQSFGSEQNHSISPYAQLASVDNNVRVRPFQNLQTFTNTHPHYDNIDRQYKMPQTQNNYFRVGFDRSNMFERFPDRGGNLDTNYRRRIEEQALNRQIIPLEKQYFKYNISKQTAIQMILIVRRYFDQKIKEYKESQNANLNKLKMLLKKILTNGYQPISVSAMIIKAKEIVSTSMHNIRDKEVASEIKNLLNHIYFEGNLMLNNKAQLLRFYKEETVRSVLEQINLQIVQIETMDRPNNLMPKFTYQIYYNPQRDFCYFNKDQQNHLYNLDETFLLLVLACKNEYPTSTLIREIMTISNLRSINMPILY